MGWLRELLMSLYLIDRPVVNRRKPDRREGSRRWVAQAKPLRDSRRKKERRKGKRRV